MLPSSYPQKRKLIDGDENNGFQLTNDRWSPFFTTSLCAFSVLLCLLCLDLYSLYCVLVFACLLIQFHMLFCMLLCLLLCIFCVLFCLLFPPLLFCVPFCVLFLCFYVCFVLTKIKLHSFLVADTQLYKRLCPSVGPSVSPSVRNHRVKKWENAHFRPCPPVRDWYWPCIRPCYHITTS